MIETKSNIHMEIKKKTSSVATAMTRFLDIDNQWLENLQHPRSKKNSQTVMMIKISRDTGANFDDESVAEDVIKNLGTSKTKDRNSPDATYGQVMKKRT